MKKIKTDFPEGSFLRRCQECGNYQEDRDPKGHPTSAFEYRKCKNCKSESLDYGSFYSKEEPSE